jgi:hypothetical protein
LIAKVQTSKAFNNFSEGVIDTSRSDWGTAQFVNFIEDEENKQYGALYDNLKEIYDKYNNQLDDLREQEKEYWRKEVPGITEDQLNEIVSNVSFETIFTDLGRDTSLWDDMHDEI